MALRQAKRRKLAFEGDLSAAEGNLSSGASTPISLADAKLSLHKHFNPTSYLKSHGWQGSGVPLDGHNGKGLKKPLALPQKRDQKGLGKNRDRAVEWWDCVFEASAKALALGSQSSTPTAASSGTSTPATGPSGTNLSLRSLASREVARRQLMSGFVRGEVLGASKIDDERSASDQVAQRDEAELPTRSKSESAAAKAQRKSEKVAKQQAKEEKRAKKEERRQLKAAEAAARSLLAAVVAPTSTVSDAEPIERSQITIANCSKAPPPSERPAEDKHRGNKKRKGRT